MSSRQKSWLTGHSLAHYHVRKCPLCRFEKGIREKSHILAHYASALAVVGIILAIAFVALFK